MDQHNNKGPVSLKMKRLVVYAFQEERIGDSYYYYVNPDTILDISGTATCQITDEVVCSARGYGHSQIRISGRWTQKLPGYNRCLAVVVYQTQEIDYFADGALDYMKSIIDRHAGVHFGLNEITTRYLAPNMAKKFATRYGKEYEDFGKYLVYFSYHQHEFLPGAEAELPSQHVLGRDAQGVHRTWLLRKRYFELLNETVVQLCVDTKTYAEQLFGNQIDCYGHAT